MCAETAAPSSRTPDRAEAWALVPAYNASRTVSRLVSALRGEGLSVLVVDDGSTDETPEVARRCGIRLIRQPNAGPAVARNRGAQAARGEWKGFSESVVRGLALMLFIGIPAGAGLIALRRPVIELIFQRGQFTPAMAARTARVLACYSTAIWAYCALHVLTRAFYSLKKPAVPARIAAAAVALNLALNLSLVWFLQESGLAIATAVCASLQVIALCLLLHRAAPLSGLASLPVTVVKTLASTALMVAAARGCLLLFAAQQPGLPLKLARATGPALAGAVAFFGAAWLLKSRELHILTGAFMKKNRKTPPE